MLHNIIEKLGTNAVAKACGVTPGCVSHWKKNGLPGTGTRPDRRGAMYEKRIAKLAGLSVSELREQLDKSEGRQSA